MTRPARPLDTKASPDDRPCLPPARAFKLRAIPNALGTPLPVTFVPTPPPFQGSSHQLSHRDITVILGFPFPAAYLRITRFPGTEKGVVPLSDNPRSDDGEKVS